MGTIRLLAFWPFGAGWMLLWATAAAAPIVIHLWSRRRRVEMDWAATRFLQAALRRHTPPVLARVRDDAVLLDPRTLDGGDEKHVEEALRNALR